MRLLFLAALYSSTYADSHETGVAWTEENCTAAGGTIVDGDGRVQSSCPDKACDWYTNNERKPWCTVKKEESCPLWTNGEYATQADVGKCTKKSWCMAKLGAVTKAAVCEGGDNCAAILEGDCVAGNAQGTDEADCVWAAEEKDADKEQATCDALKVDAAWDMTNCGTDAVNCDWVEGGDWEYMHLDDANADCAGDTDEFTEGPVHIGGGYFEGCMHADNADFDDGHAGGPHKDLPEACECMENWDQMGYYEENGDHQCHGMVGCPAEACDGHDTPWCPIKNPFACDDTVGGDDETVSRHFIWGYCHDDHVPLPEGCQCEETWMDYACDQGCLIAGTTTWHQVVDTTDATEGETATGDKTEEKAAHAKPLGDAVMEMIKAKLCPDITEAEALKSCVSEAGLFKDDKTIDEEKWNALDDDKKKAILEHIKADHPELHESLGKIKAAEDTDVTDAESSAAIIATGVAAIALLL